MRARSGRSTCFATRSAAASGTSRPAAVERLQAENKDQLKLIRSLQERLAGFEAAGLAAAAKEIGGVRQVVQAIDGREQNELRTMALAICGAPGYRVALFSTTAPYVAVLARSKDGRTDCAAALKALMAAFGGRGGGRPEMAQAGGLTGDLSQILSAARAEFERQ